MVSFCHVDYLISATATLNCTQNVSIYSGLLKYILFKVYQNVLKNKVTVLNLKFLFCFMIELLFSCYLGNPSMEANLINYYSCLERQKRQIKLS